MPDSIEQVPTPEPAKTSKTNCWLIFLALPPSAPRITFFVFRPHTHPPILPKDHRRCNYVVFFFHIYSTENVLEASHTDISNLMLHAQAQVRFRRWLSRSHEIVNFSMFGLSTKVEHPKSSMFLLLRPPIRRRKFRIILFQCRN